MKHTILTLILLIVSISSSADTLITLQNTDEAMPDKIVIKDGRVLMTEPTREGRVIFDTNARSIIVVNDKKKEYMVIDEAYMQNIGGMMNSMKSMMKGMLDQVSDEQKAQLEDLLGTNTSSTASTPYSVRKTGEKKSIKSIACDIVLVKEGDQLVAEVCVATQKASKMNQQDFATLIKMGDITQSFVDQLSQFAGDVAGDLTMGAKIISHIKGIPVEVINGDSRSIMSSITEQPIANSVFGLAGYQQVDPLQL